jgi:hypothetical protein
MKAQRIHRVFLGVIFLQFVTRALSEWTRYRSGCVVPSFDVFGTLMVGFSFVLLGVFLWFFPDKMYRHLKRNVCPIH